MRTPKKHVAKDGSVTYYVRYRVKAKTGGDGTASQTFTTKREADHFAQLLSLLGPARALDAINAEAREHDSPTLDALAEGYFEYAATRHRSDRTVADYRRDYRNWIKPTLGSRHASSIYEPDVQRLVDSWRDKIGPKSIADRHAILFGIFKWAAAPSRRLVDHNPCIGTDLPRRLKTPPKGLRPAEWQALHAALEQIDTDAADLALFMLATGWRFSEAAALSVFEVEDDGTYVTVNMGRVIRRNAAGEHVIVEDAKSAAGLRRVKLDRDASAMVRRRLDRLPVTSDALVLTTARGSQWHASNFNNRYWSPAVKAAGLGRRPTPHWLRHTSVGWLIMSGKVSLPEIQRRIGHDNISTTVDVYGRMIEDVSTEALEAFASLRSQGQPRRPQLSTQREDAT